MNMNKFIAVAGVAVLSMLTLGCVHNGNSLLATWVGGVINLNANDTVEMIKNEKEILILDVRSEKELTTKHEFLTGATMIPEDELSGRLGEISEYRNKKVLLACPCGLRSSRAADMLVKNGFEHVYNIAAPGIPGLVKVPGAPIEYR
jgi:rhodanese-related sulfurtransferase